MAVLRPEQFSLFFKAVHGVDPFPWQEKLAQTVFSANWPGALDIPTGAGKTAAIDIAVFHLALEADRRSERRAAARILFVVDRRLIVDDAFGRAKKIADKISAPQESILRALAERLRLLAEEGFNPLAVARLRGGMPKEPDWVRTPSQPTIVVSTVDQVGSRLLFRGYGVSDTMKPIHAGLIGADSLLLLDEAHLSQPFLQTVRDSLIFRAQPWTEDRVPAPFRLVTLSATLGPSDAAAEPLRISDRDRAHPALSTRLGTSKPTELIEEPTQKAMEERMTSKAWELRDVNGTATAVAVVVNRVNRARAIFNALIRKGALPFDSETNGQIEPSEIRAALLTGRVRPLDRDKLMDGLLGFLHALPVNEKRPSLGCPLIVVATQCIEAGADLDFDVLVSEIAPIDCLRQRFGRLNRMGRKIEARAAIAACSDQIKKGANDDPIYGGALKSTWNLLLQSSKTKSKKKVHGRLIDFGVAASESWFPSGDRLAESLSPKKNAPILMPSAVELWRRTSPTPFADPEVSLYLHGPASGPGDVEIVWRADLDDSLDENQKERIWTERISVCPPAAAEAISVPIEAARSWLIGSANADDIPDTEMSAADSDTTGTQPRALRWHGLEDSRLISARELSPGDIIAVSSSRGGCDRWGWNPGSCHPVHDLGREANKQLRLRDVLRLSSANLGEEELISIDDMIDWLDHEIADRFEAKFAEGGYQGRPRILRSSVRRPLAIEWKLCPDWKKKDIREISGDAVTEDDTSIRTGQKQVPLKHHSKGVETFARRFAKQAGLSPELIEDLSLSGYLHDAGKAHPDFKRFLYGGDELAASGPDLAKSAKLPANPREWEEVRRRSSLPRGARHEIASLQFAEAHSRFVTAHDSDLVLWLVGTHHGYGRPFFPAAEKDWPREGETFNTDLGDGAVGSRPAPSAAELATRWFDLSQRVAKRYGTWGLARLEAILRLADHRESEQEQEE